jgi:hypothetical protein
MPDNLADRVCRTDLLLVLVRQDDVQSLDSIVQTPRVRNPNDGRGDDRVGQGPRDGHLGHGDSQPIGNALDGLVDGDLGGFAGGLLFTTRGDATLLRVRSGEEATGLKYVA